MLVQLEKILLGLGAAAVIGLGLMITANVIARAVFASAVPDSVTIVQELMVAAIILPLAAATAARAHVTVAFLSNRFSPRFRSLLIIAGSLIGILALSPLIYAGWRELYGVATKGSFFYGDLSLPKWPGRLLFLVGMTATVARLIELLIRDIATFRAGDIVSDEQQHTGELMGEEGAR